MEKQFGELFKAMKESHEQKENFSEVSQESPFRIQKNRSCPQGEIIAGFVDGNLRKANIWLWLKTWFHINVKRCHLCNHEVQQTMNLILIAKGDTKNFYKSLDSESSLEYPSENFSLPILAETAKEENRLMSREANSIEKFFWACAGVKASSVKDYSTERIKYSVMGVMILLKTVLSIFIVLFALHTLFHSVVVIVPALLFGMLLTSLDKWMIINIRQIAVSGKWLSVFIRAVLALVCSVVIATPLMLAFFEKEIARELVADKQNTFIKKQNALNISFSEIDKLVEENERLKKDIKVREYELNKAAEAFIGEATGSSGTGIRGQGLTYRIKRENYERVKTELSYFKDRSIVAIKENEFKIDVLSEVKQKQLLSFSQANDNSDGLLSRFMALEKLQLSNPSLYKFYLFLIVFFFFIELLPVIAKVLSFEDAYDYAMLKERHVKKEFLDEQVIVDKEIEKARLYEQHRTIMKFIELKNRLAQRIITATLDVAPKDYGEVKARMISDDLVGRVQSIIAKEFNDILRKH